MPRRTQPSTRCTPSILGCGSAPQEAKDAGCPGSVTAFDGDHEAGIQAFSTRNFPNLKGPLGEIK